MGRLIITEYISLDGVFEGPGGGDEFAHSGWTFRIDRSDDGDAYKLDETRNTSALLFGRVTYDGMAAVWPHMDGEFADLWNSMPKFVVSSTLTDPDWNNTTVIDADLARSIPEMLAQVDGDLVVHGSGTLVRALLDLELVDELRLMTFPIVLGSGRQLFGPADSPHRMHLRDIRTVGDGITITTYTPELTYRVHHNMPADLDTVWHAWTDPDEYGAWFGAVPGSVELDVRPGGDWHLTTTSTTPTVPRNSADATSRSNRNDASSRPPASDPPRPPWR